MKAIQKVHNDCKCNRTAWDTEPISKLHECMLLSLCTTVVCYRTRYGGLTERDLIGRGSSHGQEEQQYKRRGGHDDAPSGKWTNLEHDVEGAAASL